MNADAARRQGRLTLVASVLLVALVSCGGDTGGESSDGAKKPPATAPVTTAPTSQPGPATGPGECPSGVGAGPTDANQAAGCLERAWRETDRSKAEVVASVDVVDTLFRDRWSPPEGTLRPCAPDPQIEGMACRYEYHGAVYLFMGRPSEGGWRVTQVEQAPSA